jgi:hypothetical protein
MNTTKNTTIDEAIRHLPEPQVIRGRLAENLRERRALRQLLKLAETARQAVGGSARVANELEAAAR